MSSSTLPIACQDIAGRMRSILSSFPESGKRVPDFCKAHNISTYRFYYWRRKLGLRGKKNRNHTHHDFLKMDFSSASSTRFGFTGFVGYELQLSGGRILRIPFSFEPNSLRTLLTLLQD